MTAEEILNDLFSSYQELIDQIEEQKDYENASKRIDEWCIDKMRGLITNHYAEKIIDKYKAESEEV